MAGILALGVAACGDDVEIVQPTPEPPPPPPPVEATMAPASASVAVGNSVVFAVNASGGVAGEAASWTCASSNTGIATVTSTSAGCSATGVAAGDVTITASVTKSGETVNVGAQLTVTSDEEPPPPAGDPAFLFISEIAGAGDTDASGLKGRVSVTVTVDRGDQEIEELSLLVDGEVVESQSFGGGGMDMGMAPPDEAAEQAAHPFKLAFNSAGYDDHGHPDYMNGEHTISAELEIGVDMADGTHGHETISSNVVTVEFKNSDFIAASVGGLGEGAMNSNTGRMWYGGPDASIEITALPVLYSSGGVSSLTLTTFCGADAQTDSEAPFSFMVACKSTHQSGADGDAPTFNVGGTTINSEGGKVYLDFKAPDAPHFKADPNEREDGWVNASVNFTGETGSGSKADGWLVYNDDNAGDGVGGYTPRLRYALAPSNNKVSTAIAADPVEAVVLPPGVSGATKENALCVVVTAVDMLGNESKLPDADDACATAADYKAAVADTAEATPSGLLAGVDVDAPTIQFSSASPKANATAFSGNFQLQVSDKGSGIRGEKSVTATASRRDATKTNKIDLSGAKLQVQLPLATTTGIPAGLGYHTVTAHTMDKAGNASEKISRTALNDTARPVTNTIAGAYDKGAFTLIATVTDNLSIKEYWPEMRFTSGPGGLTITNNTFLPQEGAVMVDAYNADDLTTSTLASDLKVKAYQAIQTDGTTLNDLASISVWARDHGDSISADALGSPTAHGMTAEANGFDIRTAGADGIGADSTAVAADYKVFQTFAADSTRVTGSTVTLKATLEGTHFDAPTPTVRGDNPATTDVVETDFVITAGVAGTEGLRDNPVTRVDFYAKVARDDGAVDGVGNDALQYIGSIDGAVAGALDFDSDDDGTNDSRRFIYELEISRTDFLAKVGGDGDYGASAAFDGAATDAADGAYVAFAVKDDKGIALQTAAGELYVKAP